MQEPTPEDYRRRYEALKAEGQKAPLGAFLPTPDVIPEAAMVARESVPPGWYWSRRLKSGETLRIVNDSGRASVSALFWNARDTSERFNPGDTVKVQWTARIGGGRLLLSDMGRVLAAVTGDTSGFHDCLTGGSTPGSNLRKYGGAVHRNSHDNFLLAAGKHGLAPRDVGSCITFFAPVVTEPDGRLRWQEARKPGQHVDLRVEMDVIVALSNCPHPLDPETEGPSVPVSLTVWRHAAAADDWCRNATAEARRAYENNAAMEGGAA
jgi:urea carboxylase-associated protein 2